MPMLVMGAGKGGPPAQTEAEPATHLLKVPELRRVRNFSAEYLVTVATKCLDDELRIDGARLRPLVQAVGR